MKRHPDLVAKTPIEQFLFTWVFGPDGSIRSGAHKLLAEAREETLAWTSTLKPGNGLRMWVEAARLQERAATDPEAALAEWQAAVAEAALPPDELVPYRFCILPALPRIMEWDWQRAAVVFQGMKETREEELLLDAVRSALRERALRDPGAVVAWLRSIEEDGTWRGERTLQNLSYEMLASSPEVSLYLGSEAAFRRSGVILLPPLPPEKAPSTLAAAVTAPSSVWHDVVVEASLNIWYTIDPAAAKAWADALPEGAFQRHVDSFFRQTDSCTEVRMYAGALEHFLFNLSQMGRGVLS